MHKRHLDSSTGLSILYPTSEDCVLPLLLVSGSVNIELMTEPLVAGNHSAFRVLEHGPVGWPAEIRSRVTVLILLLCYRNNSVEDRPQAHTGNDPQGISHFADGMATWAGSNPTRYAWWWRAPADPTAVRNRKAILLISVYLLWPTLDSVRVFLPG
jgi:hypothetical protein